MYNRSFWKDKIVFITGHTGFKGSWLSLWLQYFGATVYGYSLDPPTEPNLFTLLGLKEKIKHNVGDIRNYAKFKEAISVAKPEIVFHMAAQPLVRFSYEDPVSTYETNVMGTVNLLDIIRQCPSVKAVVVITTDKCYENKEWCWGYRENEPLGGYDPYSSSKACAELVVSAYRKSFFNPEKYKEHGCAVTSVRAGNVIGGGDWAVDRLIPDCTRALLKGERIVVRNPMAIRPWQHVLEPLYGYIMLAERLYKGDIQFADAWNFGPDDTDALPVKELVTLLCSFWGNKASYIIKENESAPHEAHYLKLDCSKARQILNWHPRWDLTTALKRVVDWTKAYQRNEEMVSCTIKQIEEYLSNNKQANTN